MNTNKKIDKVLNKIVSYIDPSSKVDRDWYNDVEAKASTFKTKEEELEYLEGILADLRPNIWPGIVIGSIIVIGAVVLYFLFLAPKSANATNASMTTAPCTFVKSDLTKEDFKIIDYVVSGSEIKPNPERKNDQYKIIANNSPENSLSSDATTAVNEMIDYMSHNVSALKEKAMTFGLIDPNFDEKKWIENRKGQLYYNKEGQEVFYQVKAFIKRSKVTAKTMAENSNYYTTGLDKNNQVVVSKNIQNLSGQHYIEVRNPENSKDQYCYIVLVYCGNTVMKNNNIPGIPTEKIEIPKPKPEKPSEPNKPDEGKVEKKDPSKDPANQGKALIGRGQNDGSENGTENTQAKLPESYSAPTAPSAPASSTAPSQDSRISEPSQWSGAGKITDSNGTTTVTNDGSVTTPDGRHYDGLVGQSAPKVESGTNGVTTPSSSANFTGSSMSQPGIDD